MHGVVTDAGQGFLSPNSVSGSTLPPGAKIALGSRTGALERRLVEGRGVYGHRVSPSRLQVRTARRAASLHEIRHCRYTIRVIGVGFRRPYTGIPPSICTESKTDRIAGLGKRLNEVSRRREGKWAGRRHRAAALTAPHGEQRKKTECGRFCRRCMPPPIWSKFDET